MADDTPNKHQNVFYIDSAITIGATNGDDERGRLHTKISNKDSEPIPIGGKTADDILAALGGPERTGIITLLRCALQELRKMNLHMEVITDEKIKDFDIPRGEIR